MRDRTARRLQAIARLRPGARLTDATRELNDVAREVSRSYGESPITGAAARWISDTQLGSLMRPLGVAMLAVTAIVLMTVCLNVASLLLTRALGNERQTAIRIAIGASRAQLVRSSLVQHGVLAMLGCAFGVVFAQMTKGALMVLVPQVALPVSLEVDVNWRVAAFAVAISMVSAMLFAIVPALGASRADVVEALRSASTTATGRLGARRALVVAQVALSFAAIVIAGLFLRSVQTAARAPLGFGDPRQVLLLSTDLSFTRLDGQRLANLIDQTLESVRQLPGVDHAALSNMVPLGFGPIPRVTTRIDGYVPAPDESMSIARAIVSDGYFDAMQIPIVHGRGVSRTDRSGAARVAVINEAMAARYWPGQESIGNRIDQGSGWAVIVGVVRDSALDSMTEPPGPMIYFPWAQMPANALSLYVRSRGNPLLLVEPVRNTLSAVNRELPVLDPRLLADAMGAATFVQSVGASVFSVFGMLSLIVTAAGLYGVVAQFVAERRKEIAILVALGATPGGVAKAILGPALQVTLWGLGLGVSLAVACTPLVRGHLAGIAPLDAISIAAAGVVMTIASVTSCAWPLWRALRIDPVITIREAS
jgi:predicted permease